MTGAVAPGSPSFGRPAHRPPFSIAHSLPGRLRLRLSARGDESHLRGAAAVLETIQGVEQVHTHLAARSLIIEYDRDVTDPEVLLQAALSAVPKDYGFKVVQAQMTVAAPVSRVWEVIVDPRYFSLHLPEAVRVTEIRDPGHWLVEFSAFRKRFRLDVHVVERLPEERVVLRADGSFTAVVTITLAASGDATIVSERVEYELPDGLIAALVGRISSRRLRDGLLAHLTAVSGLAADR